MNISQNPLDYVTIHDLIELGLSEQEIQEAYQPSSGGVYHARGTESKGKTLWVAHRYRHLIDRGIFTPYDAVGNMTFKGKYAVGYTVLKGDNLRQYLWDCLHVPYKHKIIIIDEVDSEFPARSFTDKEQTEIATRLWHTAKLGNHIFLTSHLGNSADLIMHLASHYLIFPDKPDFATNSMDFSIANCLDNEKTYWTAHDIIKTMLIYSRKELTENTEAEQAKIRPVKRNGNKPRNTDILDDSFDIEKELAF